FSVTRNASSELEHAEAVNLLGAKKASELFDLDPQVELDPVAGLDFSGLSKDLLRNLVGSDTRIDFAGTPREGSNDWTISGASTATGKPLLANDPHRVIAEPSLRYIVHLVAPGWNVIGAGEPGLPGVADGHNENIAWGFTIFGLDQQDLYIEEINPQNPDEYRTDKGWEPFETRRETIEVRGGGSAAVELRWTRHGPVLWSDGKRALALRWVGAEPGTAGYVGSLALDRAQNWTQFESAVRKHRVHRPQRQYWRALDGSCACTKELDRAASRAGRWRLRMERLCAELGSAPFLQPRGRFCGHREPQDDSGWLPVRGGVRMGHTRALSANQGCDSAGAEERAQVKRRGHGSPAERRSFASGARSAGPLTARSGGQAIRGSENLAGLELRGDRGFVSGGAV